MRFNAHDINGLLEACLRDPCEGRSSQDPMKRLLLPALSAATPLNATTASAQHGL